MKKNLFFSVLLLALGAVFTSCDTHKDDVVVQVEVDVSFFASLPYANNTQGYYYTENGVEKFFKLIPNAKAPFTLLVVLKNDEAKTALSAMKEASNTVLENVQELSAGKYIVTSRVYFESPLFYVSDNYQVEGDEIHGYPVLIDPMILIKMKEGKDIKAIEEKYGDKLTKTEENALNGIEKFNCNVSNSYEVLQLAAEISQLEDVEWAEPNKYGGFYMSN